MLLEARTAAPRRPLAGRAPRSGGPAGETWILIGLIVVAAALRFATLTSQSYWLDESQAAHELGLSFGGMLHAWSVAEWNPPLYLIVAWPWAKLFGTGEGALRTLSALLGIGLVPLLYLCGRELVSGQRPARRPASPDRAARESSGCRAGLAAAGLAAVNPFMIWYSQEAREYMLLLVLCAASLLFFARAWRSTSTRDVVWWAIFSALALLTQYFAGFLVAAEGLLLVYRLRSRASVIALAVQAAVLAPLVPHVIPRLTGAAAFITDQPLSTRLQQVPVAFALNTLFKGPLVSYGLIGAAVAAAVVIGLLLVGASDRELRGTALAAGLAAVVLLVPLAMALAGHDDYIAVGLMPAWLPLAVVFGAACTARRARLGGAALAIMLAGLFLWAGFEIDANSAYQRPNWRGVAAALGMRPASATRAIVADAGPFASGPLSVYLPGVPWSGPGESPSANAGPVTISELDVVGNAYQQLGRRPPGVRLLGSRRVDGYRVDRFALRAPWPTTPAAIAQRASSLLSLAQPGPVVMIQRPGRPSSS